MGIGLWKCSWCLFCNFQSRADCVKKIHLSPEKINNSYYANCVTTCRIFPRLTWTNPSEEKYFDRFLPRPARQSCLKWTMAIASMNADKATIFDPLERKKRHRQRVNYVKCKASCTSYLIDFVNVRENFQTAALGCKLFLTPFYVYTIRQKTSRVYWNFLKASEKDSCCLELGSKVYSRTCRNRWQHEVE